MGLYKYKRVKCIFIDTNKQVYQKKVVVVDGFAAVAFNGKTCVYDIGSSTFTLPTFKVGCTRPITAVFTSPAYYNMFNTAMMISAGRKGRCDVLSTFLSSGARLSVSLLDCIDNSVHRGKFVVVSATVLKDAGLYDFAIEKGIVEGEFVVFSKGVIEELKNT